MKNKYLTISVALMCAGLSASCDRFLDTLPDNRTEVNTDEKITSLLVSGYDEHPGIVLTEMMSDNVDSRGTLGNAYNRLQDEQFAWADMLETGNDSPKAVWDGCYGAIAVANHALQAIEEQGNPARLNPQRGEALLIRAYHHFRLINIFALHYSSLHGETDPGVPYATDPETTVAPYYERESVAEVYRKIEKDLEEGLPLIDDDIYTMPKYHFNRKAANAFAARFYLYYGKYDKVIAHANEVLGNTPVNVLRRVIDFVPLAGDYSLISNEYILPKHEANLLLIPVYCYAGSIFRNTSSGKKYMYSQYLSSSEVTRSNGPWGTYRSDLFHHRTSAYTNYGGYCCVAKHPSLFEYTDRVAAIGYTRTVQVAFTTDEVLLCRAEAYIMREEYDKAVADLALWMSNHTSSTVTLTRELINIFYSDPVPDPDRPDDPHYYTWEVPTVKKRLNPETPIVSDEQENFLHCLLHFRRIETIFDGLRWYDIKRFGIVIYRRELDANNSITLLDSLPVNDPRRAVQLPDPVIKAGMMPNPRN
ncbi:MAG: RagB/SusD family nutrient uptake outer membrane protein [Odoribacteraceae bacterium]|jgi:tetratricopeptide (TPR) repeat protein|nr:RagB/SusD family nutrient uptake outer membrane protein [Odoribacteraceae bacterium]